MYPILLLISSASAASLGGTANIEPTAKERRLQSEIVPPNQPLGTEVPEPLPDSLYFADYAPVGELPLVNVNGVRYGALMDNMLPNISPYVGPIWEARNHLLISEQKMTPYQMSAEGESSLKDWLDLVLLSGPTCSAAFTEDGPWSDEWPSLALAIQTMTVATMETGEPSLLEIVLFLEGAYPLEAVEWGLFDANTELESLKYTLKALESCLLADLVPASNIDTIEDAALLIANNQQSASSIEGLPTRASLASLTKNILGMATTEEAEVATKIIVNFIETFDRITETSSKMRNLKISPDDLDRISLRILDLSRLDAPSIDRLTELYLDANVLLRTALSPPWSEMTFLNFWSGAYQRSSSQPLRTKNRSLHTLRVFLSARPGFARTLLEVDAEEAIQLPGALIDSPMTASDVTQSQKDLLEWIVHARLLYDDAQSHLQAALQVALWAHVPSDDPLEEVLALAQARDLLQLSFQSLLPVMREHGRFSTKPISPAQMRTAGDLRRQASRAKLIGEALMAVAEGGAPPLAWVGRLPPQLEGESVEEWRQKMRASAKGFLEEASYRQQASMLLPEDPGALRAHAALLDASSEAIANAVDVIRESLGRVATIQVLEKSGRTGRDDKAEADRLRAFAQDAEDVSNQLGF